jgi:hypothetical protein
MEYLQKKNVLVSLGYNCFIKKYLNNKNILQETQLFDNIGSPMWSINEFIRNDYKYLFNINDYAYLKIYDNYNEMMMTNKKYFFVFLHDFQNKIIIDKYTNKKINISLNLKIMYYLFKEKYERRISRFKLLLSNNNSIVFFRLEESLKNKIYHNYYKNNLKYYKSEYNYLKEFSLLIKKKYKNLKFNIIFLNNSIINKFDSAYNILTINVNNINLSYDNCDYEINKIIESNKDFIMQNIK